jgi:hypothetical protein
MSVKYFALGHGQSTVQESTLPFWIASQAYPVRGPEEARTIAMPSAEFLTVLATKYRDNLTDSDTAATLDCRFSPPKPRAAFFLLPSRGS